MSFSQFRPKWIMLPDDSPLERQMARCAPAWDGPPWPRLDEAWAFDRRTVFYDITYDPKQGLFRSAGPPPGNLAGVLQGLTLKVAQGAVTAELALVMSQPDPQMAVYRTEGPVDLDPGKAIEVAVCHGDDVLGTTAIRGQRLMPGRVLAVAFQHNAEPDWVCDWLDYLDWHGVDSAVVYDNGSRTQGTIRDRLRQRQTDQAVQLIEWPFLYGPARFPGLQFSQHGQLDDVRHAFGTADWLVLLGIDTYPVLPNGQKLVDFLDQTRARIGALKMPVYDMVPSGQKEGVRDCTTMTPAPRRDICYAVRGAVAQKITPDEITLPPRFRTKEMSPAELHIARFPTLMAEDSRMLTPERLAPAPETAQLTQVRHITDIFARIDAARNSPGETDTNP